MADKVIKEHYVPRRHLRHFARDDRFFVYDKEKKQTRPGNVANYACERFFYDVDFDAIKSEMKEIDPNFEFDSEIEGFIQESDEQHIEHWFGENVETWLFDPIDTIIQKYTMGNPKNRNTISVLNDHELACLSLFLSLQVIRSKEFRESMVEVYERLPQLLIKKVASTQEEKEAADSFDFKIKNENHKKLYHAQLLTDPKYALSFAETFSNKLWMIGYNHTDIPFYTSDNPVVRCGHKNLSGFNSEGIEIFFPLTPYLALILRDPIYFRYDSGKHNHFIELDRVNVAYINALQIQQSYRYVFDATGDFRLAIGMMEKYPNLSDIRHQRFSMG